MSLKKYFDHKQHIAPLATFRVAFGLLMLISIIRFWIKGWIHAQYIEPNFYFTYLGFDWVRPLGDPGMYILFAVMAIAALMVAFGLLYRYSAILFFLSFTYVELIDKTNYLNHYYFVSLVAFLMIFLPANAYYSLDAKWGLVKKRLYVSSWTINILKLQLGITYFYAGIAKLNYDWLVKALPLSIWLPAKSHTPIIGTLLEYKWTAYFFSWFGALYDLSIPFFLLWKRTRAVAYLAVIAFHVMTAILFPIGMFPYIMIVSTLIFFSESFHIRLWSFLGFGNYGGTEFTAIKTGLRPYQRTLLISYIILQLLVPFRFLLYDGSLFWNEHGYRFSWRVMLMEKAGYTYFNVRQNSSSKSIVVDPSEHLTPVQVKMMSTQPDMILQFAHFLKDKYELEYGEVSVFAHSHVSLNGSRSKKFVNDSVNLSSQKRGLHQKDWIIPYNE